MTQERQQRRRFPSTRLGEDVAKLSIEELKKEVESRRTKIRPPPFDSDIDRSEVKRMLDCLIEITLRLTDKVMASTS